MPNLDVTSDIRSMTNSAVITLLKLEEQVLAGNDAQADRLAKQYENQLEKIFSFKCSTRESLIIKLNFSKTLISADHPMKAVVARVFDSLSKDIGSLTGQ